MGVGRSPTDELQAAVRLVKVSQKPRALATPGESRVESVRLAPEWRPFWLAVEAAKPSLVVLDPLSALAGGANLNDGGTARFVVEHIADESERHDAGVLIISHDTKAARSQAKAGGDPGAGAVAGSGTWHDAARGVLYLYKNPTKENSLMLRCLAANHGRDGWGGHAHRGARRALHGVLARGRYDDSGPSTTSWRLGERLRERPMKRGKGSSERGRVAREGSRIYTTDGPAGPAGPEELNAALRAAVDQDAIVKALAGVVQCHRGAAAEIPTEADLIDFLDDCPEADREDAHQRLTALLGTPSLWAAIPLTPPSLAVLQRADTGQWNAVPWDGPANAEVWTYLGDNIATVHARWRELDEDKRADLKQPLLPIVRAWLARRPRPVAKRHIYGSVFCDACQAYIDYQ